MQISSCIDVHTEVALRPLIGDPAGRFFFQLRRTTHQPAASWSNQVNPVAVFEDVTDRTLSNLEGKPVGKQKAARGCSRARTSRQGRSVDAPPPLAPTGRRSTQGSSITP